MSRERSDHPMNAYDPEDPRLTAYVLGELGPGELGEVDRAVVERWLEESTEARIAADEIGDVAALLEAELAREVVPSRITAVARPAPAVTRTPMRTPHGGGAVLAGVVSMFALAMLVACLPRGDETTVPPMAPVGLVIADPTDPVARLGDGLGMETNGERTHGLLSVWNYDARFDGTTWMWDAAEPSGLPLFAEWNGTSRFSTSNDFATYFARPPRLNWMGRPADLDADGTVVAFTLNHLSASNGPSVHGFADLDRNSNGIVAGDGSGGYWSIDNGKATDMGRVYFPYSPATVLWGTNSAADGLPAMTKGTALGAMSNSIATEAHFGRYGWVGRGSLDRLLREERSTEGDVGRGGEGDDAERSDRVADWIEPTFHWTRLGRAATENENSVAVRFVSPYEAPLAVVDLGVSNESYEIVRNDLANGRVPAPGSVRIGEFVNAFEYGQSAPSEGEAVECVIDAGPCPWNERHRLVLVRLRGRAAPVAPRPPLNYVFAVDVSGSMYDPGKLPVVQQGLLEIANRTTAADRLGIVAFGDEANVVLESANGDERERIREAVNGLAAGGSTNLGRGLDVAYENGSTYFRPDGRNRVVVVTDADSAREPLSAELDELIRTNSEAGLPLTVLALGPNGTRKFTTSWGLEKGVEQRLATVEDVRDTEQLLVDQLDEPAVVAEEVTATVEFNPARVQAYQRLDFDVPAVDPGAEPAESTLGRPVLVQSDPYLRGGSAGGLGGGLAGGGGAGVDGLWFDGGGARTQPSRPAAESVGRSAVLVADQSIAQLYEVVPRTKAEVETSTAPPNLRYQQFTLPADDPAHGEMLTVRLAYRLPGELERIEREFTLSAERAGDESSPDLDWAAAVAAYGIAVGKSPQRSDVSLELATKLALEAKGPDPDGRRRRFVETVLNTRVTENWQYGLAPPAPNPLPADEALAKASIDGKYRELLRTIEVDRDHLAYGSFHDWGYWEGTRYAGETDLPRAFWVYVHPKWYLWRERVVPPSGKPAAEAIPEPESMP